MMKALFILALTVISASAQNVQKSTILENFENQPTKNVFKAWHFAFSKAYDLNSEEGLNRYRIFKENVKYIKKVNSEQDQYKLGLGPFADLSYEEFSGNNLIEEDLGEKKDNNDIQMTDYFEDNIDINWNDNLPDWTSIYNVPSARFHPTYKTMRCFFDQFLMTLREVFHVHIKNQKLPFKELSIQNFLDCHTQTKCLMIPHPSIFRKEALSSSGFYTKERYPELENPEDYQMCKERGYPYDYTADIKYCNTLSQTCTLEIKAEIMKSGPALTMVYMNRDHQHYKSGVYDSKQCTGTTAIFGAVTSMKKDGNTVVLALGKEFGNNGAIKLSRDYSDAASNRNKLIYHACGSETYLAVPHDLEYIGKKTN
jgi:hypothetical protein